MSIKLKKITSLRGEHLPNLLEYMNGIRLKWDESKGYSSAFAEKHDEVLKSIINNPKKKVKIVTGFDDICNCGFCPNKREDCLSIKVRKKCRSLADKNNIVIDKVYSSGGLIEHLKKAQDRKEK